MYNCIYTDGWSAESVEKELGLTFHDTEFESLVRAIRCGHIHCPLYPQTENLFDKPMISKNETWCLSVSWQGGNLWDRNAIKEALEGGTTCRLYPEMYGFPQPAQAIIPGGVCPINTMGARTSGTTLSTQKLGLAGVKFLEWCLVWRGGIHSRWILDCWRWQISPVRGTIPIQKKCDKGNWRSA